MAELLTKKERMKVLKTLDSDLEFRYAVAGYLGLSEILKGLERIGEGQNKIWDEIRALREEQSKLWEEIKALREGQNKIWDEIRALREEQSKLWEAQSKLWETVNRLSVTVERLTITVEEEGIDVVAYKLREKLGLDIKLSRLFIDGLGEVDLYGVSDDLCVVGEATVRLGERLIDELERKIDLLRSLRPDLLRPKLIKVVYVDYATPGALVRAAERGVWILKWSGDLTPLVIHELKMK
ncbi:MAG: hypothetical protein RMH77_02560 [Sulfolobales archaeon]|nr:hypothetical protein [Sulfolobales archaeon]MCX8186015.1 hypothetical protein [Sulfolobales archaeon]MDW7969272.1 hypothetical protein [Sulfolobales archaeon]